MKKFFSLILVFAFACSPCVLAQESAAESAEELKLDKALAEANRNRELLEIWKDHVRTLTKERDEAYHQIETLKSASVSAPVVVGQAAHFGEIETQPLPNAAMPHGSPLPAAVNTSALEKDIQGYQETVKDLRRQLGEIQAQNQKMQKEILEAGNDKTLIIKDKEDAVSKIESASKQIRALKDENERLTGLLRSAAPQDVAPAAPAQAAAPSSQASSSQSMVFLQNAYNTQSAKLKKVLQEKEEIIRRADELQKKYVDLQSKIEQSRPSAPAQNPYEINYLKSQNSKLKAELERLRQTPAEKAPGAADSENESLRSQLSDLKASQEAMTRSFGRLKLENSDLANENKQLKSQLEAAAASTGANAKTDEDGAARWAVEKQNLINEIEQLKNAGEEARLAKTQLSSMRTVKNELDQSLKALQIENENLKAHVRQLQADNGQIARQAQAARTDSENAKALRQQVSALSAEKENLAKELEASKVESEKSKSLEESLHQDLENLKTENARLAGELEKAKSESETGRKTADERLAALTGEKEALTKQSEELKAQADRETEKTRSEIEALKAQNESLKTEAAKVSQLEIEKKYLQNIYSESNYKLKRRQIALDQTLRRSEALKSENQKMAAQNQSYESMQKTLQADDDLQKANLRSLTAKYESVLAQISQIRADKDRSEEQNQAARAEAASLTRKLASIQAEKENDAKQMDELRTRLSSAETAREKLTGESDTMKKAMVDLEHEAQANEDKVTGLNNQISQLREENTSLQKTQEEQSRTIDSLKASLKQSLDDIQNLKNNFQSYLESLVSSFEERQKKSAPAPVSTTT